MSLKKDETPAGIKKGNAVEFDGEKYIRLYELGKAPKLAMIFSAAFSARIINAANKL